VKRLDLPQFPHRMGGHVNRKKRRERKDSRQKDGGRKMTWERLKR